MQIPATTSHSALDLALDKSAVKLTKKINDADRKELPPKQLEFAIAASNLVDRFMGFTSKEKHKGNKVKAQARFVEAYNNIAYPDIYNIVGSRSVQTLRTWQTKYIKYGKDFRILAPQYKIKKACSVTPQESEVLIRLLLHPGKPLISEVIRQSINYFEAKRFHHIKSYNTYKRYLDEWTKNNYADYVFYRDGEKGLDDKVLPYVERDWNMVEVGDLIIMDGHVNNYEIINPFTGKPKRMITIGAIDGRSQFLAGYEIAITENVASIASALRRAILTLGKVPKIVYIDNGKAFTAKYFHGDDIDKLEPLFARLGIKTIIAKAYHAQSKPIEPFWGWMAELERMIPTYVGTSIEMQPPRMNRGEFLHRKLYNKAMQNTTIDIFAAHKAMSWWLDQYHNRVKEDGHLKGLTPAQVFTSGKGPGIDKANLNYLMLDLEISTLYRKGIRMFGNWYWHDSLFGKQIDAGDEVRIKYDLIDRESILVYDREGNFVCEAFDVKKVHPAAGLLGEPEHKLELKNQLALKEKLKTSVVGDARKFMEEEIFPFVKKQLNDANILELPEVSESENVKRETGNERKKYKNISDRWAKII
jgi:putative transposase